MFGAAGQKATELPLESGTMFETKAITRAAAGICYAGGSLLCQNGPGGRKAQPSGPFVCSENHSLGEWFKRRLMSNMM